ATPGDHHEHLKPLEGSWTTEVKTWMTAGGEPMTSTGTAEAKMIFDGRYLHQEDSGSFMDKPFMGMGITGYDNMKQKYMNVWLDNMGTGLYTSEGTCDATGKVFTYRGAYTDPMTKKMKKTKWVITVVDDNKHTMEGW